MGRPTVARSIKRRRLKALGKDHQQPGQDVPCHLVNTSDVVVQDHKQAEIDALTAQLRAHGVEVTVKKPAKKTSSKKKASK